MTGHDETVIREITDPDLIFSSIYNYVYTIEITLFLNIIITRKNQIRIFLKGRIRIRNCVRSRSKSALSDPDPQSYTEDPRHCIK